MNFEYNMFPDKGLPGARIDLSYGFTKTYNNASEVIPFGRIVAKVSGEENGIKLPTVTGDVMLGGVLRADALAINGEYPLNEAVAVMRQGTMFVETETDMTPDSAVFVRFTGKKQVQTITFNGDFVSLNKINLKIDGVAMTEVVFDTNQSTTMGLVTAQILADFPQVSTCTASGRVITVTTATMGEDIVISNVVVTLGSAQATAVIAETVNSVALSEAGRVRSDADSTTAVAVTRYEVLDNAVAGDVVALYIKY